MGQAVAKGVYALAVRLKRRAVLTVAGARRPLTAGYYLYAGSAQGGLPGRLSRHLGPRRAGRWHVDALLDAGEVVDIQVRFTRRKSDECRLAREIATWPGAQPVDRFGASDCRCATHLFRFTRRPGASLLARAVGPAIERMVGVLHDLYGEGLPRESDPFQTLVGCILSLRTQDPVTAAAADRLFSTIATPRQLAAADPKSIARTIYPVGMYNEKAKTIVAIAREILTRFDGGVPSEIDALITLPGVGRKTANLVRSFAFGLPAVCVDTHVHRITNRWGLVRTQTPKQTEEELRRVLPQSAWIAINPLLVTHGQRTCRPIRPRCARCRLAGDCAFPALQRERALLDVIENAPSHPSLTRFDTEGAAGEAPASRPRRRADSPSHRSSAAVRRGKE